MLRCFPAVVVLGSCSWLAAQQAPSPTPANPAPDSQAAATVPARPPQPHTLMDGTPIKLRISETMSSASAKTGQEVPFEVVEEVKVDDVVVLPKGATAIGTVTDAYPRKSMGRGGKLDISITYARLADQEKCALRATQDAKGGGHVGAMTGAIVATSIVFFPAAPLFLFMHGKDITIPDGTEVTAFVEGDVHLDMTRFGVAPPAPPAAAAPESQASLIVESSPPGADIEVDGNFVGNTPSTVTAKPGTHQITVKKNGYAEWSRKLDVTGGSIHLDAELEAVGAVVPATTPSPQSTPAAAPAPASAPAPK